MDRYTITSVLGFKLKVDIRDKDGNVIPSGVRKTVYPIEIAERVNVRLFDKRFFTTFNEGLLNKVRDHKTLND